MRSWIFRHYPRLARAYASRGHTSPESGGGGVRGQKDVVLHPLPRRRIPSSR